MNPRVITDDSVRELAESIKQYGVLEPLVIQQTGEIIAGHRRYAAAKLAGLKMVPVIELQVTSRAIPELMLAENVHRKDLAPSEIGTLLQCIRSDGLSKSKIAKVTGLTGTEVDNCLMLLELPIEIRRSVDSGLIQMNCAWLIRKEPPERQREIAKRIIDEGLTAKQVTAFLKGNPQTANGGATAYAMDRQTDISWCIDQCIEMRTRLEKYRGLQELPLYTEKIENRLQSVSKDLYQLCEALVDAAASRRN
jgi:ParB/RepB/Spo0J family partition protein